MQGINFSNFTLHMALGIVLVCVQTSLQVRYMFRDSARLRLKEPRHIQGHTPLIHTLTKIPFLFTSTSISWSDVKYLISFIYRTFKHIFLLLS